jgi:Ca2+-transporting ATPase
MGPTCSLIYENEPIEDNLMKQKPRQFTKSFFNSQELGMSILQGLAITAGALAIYQYAAFYNASEETVRTMVFTTIISANIFLTLVNRSFHYSILKTLKWKNNLVSLIIMITILLAAVLLYVPQASAFFGFHSPDITQLSLSIGTGFITVVWFEVVKWTKRRP